MILTCPECATRYFVDDDKVGAAGRTVRCAACGHRWSARAEPVLDLIASPELGALAQEPSPPATKAEATPSLDQPVKAETLAKLPGEALPKAFRAKAQSEKTMRQAAAAGVVWAALGSVFVLTLAAAAIFRVEAVRLWPRAAGAYAAVGLKVNPTGLVFEDVSAQPALQDGRAALVVSGAIRNIKDEPAEAPPLRIDLLDKTGKRVAGKIADPDRALIPAGETRHFVVSVLDPPAAAQNVEVVFVLGAKPKPKDTGGAKRAAPSLRGAAAPSPPSAPPPAQTATPAVPTTPTPIIEEARPLPPGSPHALPAPTPPGNG